MTQIYTKHPKAVALKTYFKTTTKSGKPGAYKYVHLAAGAKTDPWRGHKKG